MLLGLNMKAFNAYKNMLGTYFRLLRELPSIAIDFMIMIIQTFFSVFTYHIFSLPSKPFNNELVLLIGSDSDLGRAFASQVVKLNGTVICVDKSAERGEVFVKSLNDSARAQLAHFKEVTDIRSKDELSRVILEVIKEIGDVTVLVNCSETSTVATYYSLKEDLFPTMQGNKKGTFVFLRTFDNDETRNAIIPLYNKVTKELKATNCDTVSTLIAHIYPKVTADNESHGIFGHVKPEYVASTVLEGVAKNRETVWIPEYMLFVSFWVNFLPSGLVDVIDRALFDTKK